MFIPVSNMSCQYAQHIRQELFTIRINLGSPPVLVGPWGADLFFVVFCAVFCFCFFVLVYCAQCWESLWIAHSWLPLLVSLTFIKGQSLWIYRVGIIPNYSSPPNSLHISSKSIHMFCLSNFADIYVHKYKMFRCFSI